LQMDCMKNTSVSSNKEGIQWEKLQKHHIALMMIFLMLWLYSKLKGAAMYDKEISHF